MQSPSSASQRGAVRATTLLGILLVGVAIVAVILFFATRLTRAHPKGAVLRVVPKDATTLVFAPSPRRLLGDAEAAAASLGLTGRVDAGLATVARQLGFDPTDPEALAERGLDPDGGLAIFTLPLGRVGVAALRTTDAGRFERTLLDLVEARTGAHRGETVDVSGIPVKTALGPEGRLVLAWAYRGDVAVLSTGDGAPDRVAVAVAGRKGTSIEDEPFFARSRTRLGEDVDLLLWASSAGLARLRPRVEGLKAGALGLSVSSTKLALRAYLDLDGGLGDVLASLRAPKDAGRLVAAVDPKALVVARATADLPALWKGLRKGRLPRRLDDLQARLLAGGVKLDEDVLSLLRGSAVLDLRLAPSPDLTRMPSLDGRGGTNPFDDVQVTVLAPVRDAGKAAAVLPKVADALGPVIHAAIERTEVEGRPAWVVHYHLGEGMTFGLYDDLLVVAGGRGAYRAALQRLAGHGEAAFGNERMRRSLEGDAALSVVLDVQGLLESIRGLPSQAFGGGPNGVVVRSMAGRAVSAFDGVTDVLGTLSPDGQSLQAKVEVDLRPPAQRRAE